MQIATVLGDWNDNMMGGNGSGWWIGLMMVLSIAALAVIVWLIARSSHPSGAGPSRTARDILHERYARGEIDSKEYDERLGNLR
jgi:putative membrane protein